MALKDCRVAQIGDLYYLTYTAVSDNRVGVGFETLLAANIFRIIQKLVNNSIKHSKGTEIQITLRQTDFIQITVTDDGQGFDHKNSIEKAGSGLKSLKNKVALLDGKLMVTSANPGIKVIIKIPSEIERKSSSP
ncbi:MAG: ATP-binding protein [Mucilaginibacter sp.]